MEHQILGPGFAVEIQGVDLSQEQSPDAVAAMRDLWLEHKIAVFRDQALDDEDLIRFAEYFGPTYVYVRAQFNDRKRPVVTIISNIQEDGRKLGDLGDGEVHWHTDQAYSKEGSFGTILYGVEIPADGGATCYGDLARAYAALPEATKQKIADKTVTYSIARAAETQASPRTSAGRNRRCPILWCAGIRTWIAPRSISVRTMPCMWMEWRRRKAMPCSGKFTPMRPSRSSSIAINGAKAIWSSTTILRRSTGAIRFRPSSGASSGERDSCCRRMPGPGSRMAVGIGCRDRRAG